MKVALGCAALATGLAGCAARANGPAEDPYVRTFRSLRPSVVLFTMKIPSDDKKRKGSFDDAYGSGVVIASGTWGSRILTVQHVVDGASKLRATLDDAQSFPARVLASDVKKDLALVEISVPNRPVAQLGASAAVEPGAPIGVAGYPIPDEFEDEHLERRSSVFFGRVSSIRNDALELDVPIIPGESGGPVFDALTGSVIGLAESRFDDEKAIGFGVPIEDAKAFLRAAPPPPA